MTNKTHLNAVISQITQIIFQKIPSPANPFWPAELFRK